MSKTLKNITLVGLFAAFALFLFSVIARRMHVDDVILSEPTYWLSQLGYLRSPGMLGWQHAEDKFLFTHKLYVYSGALFINLFGWSSAAVKSLSFAYLLVLLSVAYGLMNYLKIEKIWFAFFAFLTITNSHIFELSFVYRPEIAVASCMLGCYFLLQLYLDRNSIAYLFFAGVVAALGIGNHLNGVIIPGAGCLLLIYHRRFSAMLTFGTIAAFGFLFQLLGITSAQDFQMMRDQFSHMQDIQGEHFNAFHYLLNIPNEQQRYLHSPREMAFTLLFLPVLLIARKSLWKRYSSLVVYTGAGALTLAVIAHGKDTKYLAILIPLILLMTTISFPEVLQKYKKVALTLLALYVATEFYFNVALAFDKEHRSEQYQTLVGDLPEGSKILTPVYATYWATPRYQMQWFFPYKVRAAHKDFEMTMTALSQELDRFGIDYVIFEKEEYDIYQPTSENMPKFELKNTDVQNNLWFFQRKNRNSGIL